MNAPRIQRTSHGGQRGRGKRTLPHANPEKCRPARAPGATLSCRPAPARPAGPTLCRACRRPQPGPEGSPAGLRPCPHGSLLQAPPTPALVLPPGLPKCSSVWAPPPCSPRRAAWAAAGLGPRPPVRRRLNRTASDPWSGLPAAHGAEPPSQDPSQPQRGLKPTTPHLGPCSQVFTRKRPGGLCVYNSTRASCTIRFEKRVLAKQVLKCY